MRCGNRPIVLFGGADRNAANYASVDRRRARNAFAVVKRRTADPGSGVVGLNSKLLKKGEGCIHGSKG